MRSPSGLPKVGHPHCPPTVRFGLLFIGLVGVLVVASVVNAQSYSSCGVGTYQTTLSLSGSPHVLGQPIATYDNTKIIRILPNPSGVGPHVWVDPLNGSGFVARNYTSPLFNSPLAATFARNDPTNNTLLITNSGNNNILELILSTGAVRVAGVMPAGITPTAITSNSAGTKYAITSWSGGAIYLMNSTTYTITQGPSLSVYHNPAGIAALPTTPNTVTIATNYTGSCITANAGAWLYDTITGTADKADVWETCEVTRGLTYVGSTLYMTTASGYVVRVGPAISVVCSLTGGFGSGLGLMSSNSAGDLFVADTNSAQVYQISRCPAGTASTGGLNACPPCQPGTFAASTGQTVCTPCANGTTSGTGATVCFAPHVVSAPTITYQSSGATAGSTVGCAQPLTFTSRVSVGSQATAGVGVIFTITGKAADGSVVAISSPTITSDANGLVAFSVAGLAGSDANGYTVQVSGTESNGQSFSSTPLTFNVGLVPNSVQVTYTGSLSSYTAAVYAFESSVPVSDALLVAADQSQFGSFSYSIDGGFICSGPAELSDDGKSLQGTCPFDVLPITPGSHTITTTYSFLVDSCNQFTGSVTTPFLIDDLTAFQTGISNLQAGLQAEITARTNGDANEAIQRNATDNAINQALTQEINARLTSEFGINQSIQSEVTARTNSEAGINQSIQQEVTARTAAMAALNQTVLLQQAAIGALQVTVQQQQAAIDQLNQPHGFLFFGLTKSISAAYPKGANPGATSYLNATLKFDLALTTVPTGLSYDSTTGFATFTKAGNYRLDAFVHLVDASGTGSVGTGVVAWCPYNTNKPMGPNILNDQTGIAQGVAGDDSIISTLISVQPADLPKKIRLVLLTANQKTSLITDASTISITQL